jgi:uncharacterized protein (TIGR02646 family)
MRPVERGSVPIDPTTGVQISFKKYGDAKPELLQRIGKYCSYCEKPLTQLIDVEHILPKTHFPQLKTNWHNFLISCRVCNDIKGHSKIKRKDFYWTDVDNTFRILEFHLSSGAISVNHSLSITEQVIAKNTIGLLGLDRKPGHPDYKARSADKRWQERLTTLGIAQEALRDLQNNDISQMRNQIVRTAQGQGFWSIWMTVFQNDSDMLNRFIDAFPGTCRSCFDERGQSVPRLKGRS